MRTLWAHQKRGLADLWARIAPGARIVLTAPTGAGKSEMMKEVIRRAVAQGQSVLLLTNRRMLLAQIGAGLTAAGVAFGVIAAGYERSIAPVQLATVQTLVKRGFKKGVAIHLPPADIIITDEAHVIREASAAMIYDAYPEACKIGFTATPLDIGHIYDQLVVAGKPSELRECGTLVPAYYYAPDEPDTRNLKRTKTGEYAEGQKIKAIMSPTILGRVAEHWRLLNPNALPTLLFAPGVRESQWFAERLSQEGIPAAHIDGEQVWWDGLFYDSTDENREMVVKHLEAGTIKVLCNRFVLREGIDLPFVRHIVCATIFGSLGAYIQSLGRGLRACPSVGKDGVVIQDHGGNWHRHGSINADREWNLGDSSYVVGELREERLKTKQEPEPIQCPRCHMVRMSGPKCPGCGHQHRASSRMVVQRDGRLKAVQGDIYHEPRYDRSSRETMAKQWESCYWSCHRAGKSFREAVGLYCYRHNYLHPPRDLPLMPTNERDWFMPVKDVPMARLRSKSESLFAGGAA